MDAETALPLLNTYAAAWSEPDSAKRLKMLEATWVSDGTYYDPHVEVIGHQALADYMHGFQGNVPGGHFVYTTKPDGHHNFFRVSWKLLDAAKTTLHVGTSFMQFADEGRLVRVTGFFGEPVGA
ncbi:nuclear transport factor 2 family protein [Dyella subtropica]|uniref:nuclear transport factor 2 family protein n=1 Tax=Dyella subtropica TaxID=2992127 RepID=UPI00224EB01D|nr:nuclear transport factor 2 family protein [Dyella subtropica]